jgi:hypothetical protein
MAGWRMSLRRTLADWPMVAAAWLITLLAATLVSTGPIYSSAAAVAGVRRAIADAPAADTTVRASFYASPETTAQVDRQIRLELESAMGSLGSTIISDERSTETFALPGPRDALVQNRALLGALDRLSDHATLTAGRWPADRRAGDAPVQVAVLDNVARQLDLTVGQELRVVRRSFGEDVVVVAQLVGTFAIDLPTDPYWRDDPQLTTGVVDKRSFLALGPFFTTGNTLASLPAVESVHVVWTTFPGLDRLTVEDAPQIRARLAALPDRLSTTAKLPVTVATGLPELLATAERSLLVSGASVLLLMLQLAMLAAYAIVLTSSLMVEHRRTETALLRSRGAGPLHVALVALGEGLLLAVPAVLLAPWLAAGALGLVNVIGPLADARLGLQPRVSVDAYLAATLAGLVCVALLVVPVLLASRNFATTERERSRQETRTFGQRMGIDVALLAVAGLALWQLRLYGAPLTQTVQGSLGLDPLLVAAPAIGLLTGGVLALRVLPLLAEAGQALAARGRDLVLSLGVQQLARRPLRYTRAALLLMIAISTGVFALSYTATWSSSQRDQAAYQSGADVRVVPSRGIGSLPVWALRDAYSGLPGVQGVSPVERETGQIEFTAGSGDILAVDADTAAGVVLLRQDGATPSLDGLMAGLRAGRPRLQLVALPEGATFLKVTPRVDVNELTGIEVDQNTGEVQATRLPAERLRTALLGVRATIRDAHGVLYEVASDQVPLSRSGQPMVISLQPVDARVAGAVQQLGAAMDGPVQVAGLGVDVWLPVDSRASGGQIGLSDFATSDRADGGWTDMSVATSDGWRTRLGQFGELIEGPADQSNGVTMPLAGEGGSLFGEGPGRPPVAIGFLPESIAAFSQPISVIVNRTFLTATGYGQGEGFSVSIEGEQRTISIAAVVEAFPATDPAKPVMVMDGQVLGLLRLQSDNDLKPADEWWMATAGEDASQAVAALRGDPFDSTEVMTVADRTRSLRNDPVALGIIGALMLGFAAAGFFAMIGLIVSAAVSAGQRRAEFAVLRALGLSGRQLAGWLWLENGTLVLVSVLTGTGLGLLIGWLVLPFVTVTQQGTAPVPSVLVDIPWDRILLLDLASVLALGGAVVVIGSFMRRLGLGAVLRMGED